MTLSEYRSLRKRMRVAAFTLFAFVAGFAAGAAPGFHAPAQAATDAPCERDYILL